MKKADPPLTEFSDPELEQLVAETDKRILALWAKECALRVLHYFEEQYPDDGRPRTALEALQDWIDTGEFSMKVIRKASLDSHAAAREAGEGGPARSAARACGQAVATAHVSTHSRGAALYAQQAVHRAAEAGEAENAVKKERGRQYRRLLELRNVG